MTASYSIGKEPKTLKRQPFRPENNGKQSADEQMKSRQMPPSVLSIPKNKFGRSDKNNQIDFCENAEKNLGDCARKPALLQYAYTGRERRSKDALRGRRKQKP